MRTFHLIVSSPDGYVLDATAVKITLRGAEGDLAILAGHIPFVTSVRAGDCRITLQDGTDKTGYTGGGLLSVSGETVTLLSGSFHW